MFVRLGKYRNSCLGDEMWCADPFGRLRPEFQPGQSNSLLLCMARQCPKGTGLLEGGLGRDLPSVPLPLGMHFPPLLPGININKVWGVTSLKKKKKVNDQTQASVFWKEENCETVPPDVSSNTTAGASAVCLKKDSSVSSS